MLIAIVSVVSLLAISKFTIGALQDNFIADLKTTYTTSAEFMAFYGMVNFSVYIMAYVYGPVHSTPIGKFWVIWFYLLAKNFISEAQITKDNPAFSMINDSDEDVIYGSDEDSRQPLNRSCNHDDSDWKGFWREKKFRQ